MSKKNERISYQEKWPRRPKRKNSDEEDRCCVCGAKAAVSSKGNSYCQDCAKRFAK